MQRAEDPIASAEQWTKTIGKERDHCKKTISKLEPVENKEQFCLKYFLSIPLKLYRDVL